MSEKHVRGRGQVRYVPNHSPSPSPEPRHRSSSRAPKSHSSRSRGDREKSSSSHRSHRGDRDGSHRSHRDDRDTDTRSDHRDRRRRDRRQSVSPSRSPSSSSSVREKPIKKKRQQRRMRVHEDPGNSLATDQMRGLIDAALDKVEPSKRQTTVENLLTSLVKAQRNARSQDENWSRKIEAMLSQYGGYYRVAATKEYLHRGEGRFAARVDIVDKDGEKVEGFYATARASQKHEARKLALKDLCTCLETRALPIPPSADDA